MSMFDYLYIDSKLLPVSDEEKAILNESSWQTKDFDNEMTEVYITDEGELQINKWNYEIVPPEERPYPDKRSPYYFFGSLRRVNEHLEKQLFTGIVNFYTSAEGGMWYEFNAEFKEGKLIKIEKVE